MLNFIRQQIAFKLKGEIKNCAAQFERNHLKNMEAEIREADFVLIMARR
jgi:hypothetical protein